MIHSKIFLLSRKIKSISANSYRLLLLAANFKLKFLISKQFEVSSENIQLIPISIINQKID